MQIFEYKRRSGRVAPVCKTGGLTALVGSNPTLGTNFQKPCGGTVYAAVSKAVKTEGLIPTGATNLSRCGVTEA